MTRGADFEISDEVWHDLAPVAADVDRRERRVTRRVFLGAVTAAVVYGLVWWSGLVTPHLQATGSGGQSGIESATPRGTTTLDLRNGGWVAAQVTGVTTTHPGLRVTRSAMSPSTLGPGESGTLTFDWVADCALAAPVALDPSQSLGVDVPLTLRVARPWGQSTVSMSMNDIGALDEMVNSLCHPETTG